MAKKVYVGVNNVLPTGYTQVEYIQSSGTQYINTGFKPNQDTRVIIDAQFVGTPDSGGSAVLGTRTGAGNAEFSVFYMPSQMFIGYANAYKFADWSYINSRLTIDINKNITTVTDGSHTATVTQTYSSFTAANNLYICTCINSGTPYTGATAFTGKIYSCKVYNNGTLIRDFVPCKNSTGAIGLYDLANSVFYANTGSGTFVSGSAYSDGTARQSKKGYIGVSDKARKIKKGYVGVGGVARPFWSGGELAYYGAITNLSTSRSNPAATSVGNYALFGGGQSGSTSYTNKVDAYNTSLTKSTPTTLSDSRGGLSATTVGNYALFAGGRASGYPTTIYNTVNSYSTSLTRSTRTGLSVARYDMAATTVGNYAIFGGGITEEDDDYYSAVVDAYNSSLTRTSVSDLSDSRARLAATTVGNYALFGGGYNSVYAVDYYNSSLTHGTASTLSIGRHDLSATTVGNYALFAGGSEDRNDVTVTTVDAYNTSLTRISCTGLSLAKDNPAATTVGEFALFGGGGAAGDRLSTVDVYNTSLTRTITTDLSVARSGLSATTVGNFAIFGGGTDGVSAGRVRYSSTVDAYTIV